jgi:hypothetical protein
MPVTVWDKIMNTAMYSLYHTFNSLTGYKEGASSVTSIEWRLIVLESFAGVPGFVAAGFRHFHSLRALKRDHGWIMTLLEEVSQYKCIIMCITIRCITIRCIIRYHLLVLNEYSYSL